MHSIATLAALLISFVATSAFAQSTKTVNVANFPEVQTVEGAVEVTNDETNPVEVTGAVEVTNLPAPAGASRFL